jgi:hypothetical protein
VEGGGVDGGVVDGRGVDGRGVDGGVVDGRRSGRTEEEWMGGGGVSELMGRVRNVVLINVYLDLENPGGGWDFGWEGI